MTSTAIAFHPALAFRSGWPLRIAAAALLTALADWLFFRHVVGISLVLFVLAVGAGVLAANRIAASRRETLLYAGLLVAAVLPALEDFNPMSALIAAAGIGSFALGVTAALRGGLVERAMSVGWFLVSGPFQFLRDLERLADWSREHGAPKGLNAAKGWVLPLTFGAVFVALFAAANPLIANWLSQWSLGESIKLLNMQRLLFWVVAAVGVWAFVCGCSRFARPAFGAPPADAPAAISFSPVFDDTSILRSLVLFNILFAVQTVLDLNYLWAGAALPDGMSYASYAHRGAYPLIVTALLAAAFVIAAMRPGSDAERSPLMRVLVFLWVGQNVLLVISSILRLDLYVQVYLLTYWRMAAFIWMLLVATGLILVAMRIVTGRSNAWLISVNAATLVLTIYGCSFVNFAGFVASYNVAHSRDAGTAGRPIDLGYLVALGPQAIPALDRYLAGNNGQPGYFRYRRDELAATHQRDTSDWRSWTIRGWRLDLYLDEAKGPQP